MTLKIRNPWPRPGFPAEQAIPCMSRQGRPKSDSGFTMIEVVVVLIILGILGTVIAARIFSTSTHELAAQVEVIKAHLRYAQTRAMGFDEVWWGINLNTAATYSLFRNGDTTDTVNLPGEDDPVSLPDGITVSVPVAPFVVSFNNWGKPYTDQDGQTAQGDDRTITISLGGDSESITITANTGFIP